jgi:hypothetical protein
MVILHILRTGKRLHIGSGTQRGDAGGGAAGRNENTARDLGREFGVARGARFARPEITLNNRRIYDYPTISKCKATKHILICFD